MRLICRKLLVPPALAIAAVAAVSAAIPAKHLQAALPSNAAFEQRELRRIHAHFDSVLSELARVDVSQLTKTQSTQRQSLVATLRGYNERGVFPHNYDFSAPTPYFVDRKTGTLCAVAFLLESTGRRDIVDRVAKANNNVWVAALKGDTAFASWLDARGITLNEAARIQVPYMGEEPPPPVELKSGGDTWMYVSGVAALTTLATSVGTTAWNALGNADGHGKKRAVVGLVSSLATSVVGGVVFYQGGPGSRNKLTGSAGVAIGAIGMGFATRSLMHRSSYLASKREGTNAKRATIETNISPILPVGKNGGTGLSMSVRF